MNRRDFFKNSSLIAVGSVVPEFLCAPLWLRSLAKIISSSFWK